MIVNTLVWRVGSGFAGTRFGPFASAADPGKSAFPQSMAETFECFAEIGPPVEIPVRQTEIDGINFIFNANILRSRWCEQFK